LYCAVNRAKIIIGAFDNRFGKVRSIYMDFDWITPEEAAQKWGIKPRQVQALCSKGKILGVVRLSRAWLIPKDAVKPRDTGYKISIF